MLEGRIEDPVQFRNRPWSASAMPSCEKSVNRRHRGIHASKVQVRLLPTKAEYEAGVRQIAAVVDGSAGDGIAGLTCLTLHTTASPWRLRMTVPVPFAKLLALFIGSGGRSL